HRRRAHGSGDEDIGVVGQFIEGYHPNRAEFGDRLAAKQRTEIRVAAAAGTEERRADGEMFDILERDFGRHHRHSAKARSPMARQTMRVAPPGRYCRGTASTLTILILSGAAPALIACARACASASAIAAERASPSGML